jgi:site-specific recombinase XerD
MIITYPVLNQRLSDYLVFIFSKDRLLYNFNQILFNTGCRVREVWEWERWSFNPDETLTCYTEKGSNPRIFTQGQLTEYFVTKILTSTNPWPYNSYDTFNLYFNRSSGCNNIKHKSKPLSLSLYRHRYAKYLHNEGFSDEAIQAKMGEKDIRNSNNYVYSILEE